MGEAQDPNINHIKEDVDAEQSLLLQVQAVQRNELDLRGILDKARAIGKRIDRPDEKAVVYKVNRLTGRDKDNNASVTEYGICFDRIDMKGGSEGHSFSYVPVAQEMEGVLLPMHDFSDESAETVARMARELAQMKEDGLLTRLNGNLINVSDPLTGISLAESGEEKEPPAETE